MRLRSGIINRNNIIIAIGALGLLLFYFIFDPVNYGWMPQCMFHKLTGLQCMGCGSQRMIHAMLHGDLKGAWEANRFLLMAFPFIIMWIVVELNRKRYPSFYSRLHSLPVIITSTAMLLAWLFVRNIYGI